MNDAVNRKLELARFELLDMGLRGNTLLHLRPTARTLEIIDEVSNEIYRILVEENKAMTFSPIPDGLIDEDNPDEDTKPLPELLEEVFGENRHTDTKLQTKLNADKLDKRLLKISTEATTYFQEQGVGILYLALGFLTWFEDNNSSTPRKAPLILIPVALERATAKERFKLTYTQADIGPNLTLAEKLKMDFRVVMPDFSEEFEPQAYFNSINNQIKSMPKWQLDTDEIALGLFSFGKFQMYQDLAEDNWPIDKKPSAHPVLNGLLLNGFQGTELLSSNSGNGAQPNEATPHLVDLNFVKDADSSQTEAVLAVKKGANLVIQGPPGTGKSQTITNIISESLADGKKILFVAEKMAALEVVKRRLDDCHLGDAVLELHSNKSNKKAVLDELKRTLELGEPKVQDRTPEKTRHSTLQKQLDQYCQAVNQPILNSGISYIDAQGYYLKLKDTVAELSLPSLKFEPMCNWDQNSFNQACSLVIEMATHLEEMGRPADNAFSDSTLEDFSPIEQNQITTLLKESCSLLVTCWQQGNKLADEMSLTAPKTLSDLETLNKAAQRAIQAPHLKGLTLTTDDWQTRRDQIQELLQSGSKIKSIKDNRNGQIIDQGWNVDLLKTRTIWATTGKKWWCFLSSDYRAAKRDLQGILKGDLPGSADQSIALLDDILEFQTQQVIFNKHERLGESLFGAQWQHEKSDWEVLSTLSGWVLELYDEVGKGDIPEGVLRFLEGEKELTEWAPQLDKLSQQANTLIEKITEVSGKLDSPLPTNKNETVNGSQMSMLAKTLKNWHQHIDDLYQMTRYNRLCTQLENLELDEVCDLSFDWSAPFKHLITAVKIAWYSGLIEESYRQRSELRQFDRINHESVIKEFKQLDKNLFQHTQESLLTKLFNQTPNASGAGEVAIIRREMNKKRRHWPIRKLIAQAGRAIQQAKPVFMMSPMSVATYLEQGTVEFDLVIFDEASQVKVVDAIGPILRAKQVVVVGDTKQMPPTDFFGKAIELDGEDAEESQTADIESILSMFLAQGADEKMLRWHYRSRHDSLIAVSNREFYDGKLMIFPSPGVNPDAKGLLFHHCPETTYDRGGSRTNSGEARIVAEAVMNHARLSPEKTLGVVAFSTAQRDAILLEIERLRREDPSYEEFFQPNADNSELFFVKNLENVQGDERDIIMISIAYGRTAGGTVSRSFGPINREGGERRLNVLITRARLGMEVFCNFQADDLLTTADTPLGVRILKNFLKFAETGQMEEHLETGKDTDSPFEDEVIKAIRGLGYDVEPQVGSAGFFIDIAIRDPNKPGRYILAVECDGASYHSSANARDRDRLRQDVLEGLGWRFHRIWSTDWFRNAIKETDRLKDAITNTLAYYEQLDENIESIQPAQHKTEAPAFRISRSSQTEEQANNSEMYKIFTGSLSLPHGIEIQNMDQSMLARCVNKLIQEEGPIHIKEAAKRITDAVGVSRIGPRIMKHIESSVQHGHSKNDFFYENDFIYLNDKKETSIRNRNELPNAQKKIDFVPDEEILGAIIKSLEMAFSLSKADTIAESLSLMGFQRSTEKARIRLENVIQHLLDNRKITLNDEMLTITR